MEAESDLFGSITDLQLIHHSKALIYTTKHDGEIKRAVKSNTTFADFMEFDKVKPMMDEIEAMLDKKKFKRSQGYQGAPAKFLFKKIHQWETHFDRLCFVILLNKDDDVSVIGHMGPDDDSELEEEGGATTNPSEQKVPVSTVSCFL